MADDAHTSRGAASPHVDAGLCTDILTGLAPPETVSRALAHLKTCPACEGRFRLMAGDHEALRAGPAPRRSAAGGIVLGGGSAGIGGFLRAVRPILPRLQRPLAVVAAAAAVILVVATPWRRQPPPPDLAYWFPARGELLAQRSSGGSAGFGELVEGIRAYDRRDLGRAVHHLERARTTGGDEDLRRLYLASALQLRGESSRSLRVVSGIDLASLPEARADEARWVRYVALVEVGRARESAALLDSLAAAGGPIGELARRRRSVISTGASPGRP